MIGDLDTQSDWWRRHDDNVQREELEWTFQLREEQLRADARERNLERLRQRNETLEEKTRAEVTATTPPINSHNAHDWPPLSFQAVHIFAAWPSDAPDPM